MKKILGLVILVLFQVCLAASTVPLVQEEVCRRGSIGSHKASVCYLPDVFSVEDVQFRIDLNTDFSNIVFMDEDNYRKTSVVQVLTSSQSERGKILPLSRFVSDTLGYGKHRYAFIFETSKGDLLVNNISINLKKPKMAQQSIKSPFGVELRVTKSAPLTFAYIEVQLEEKALAVQQLILTNGQSKVSNPTIFKYVGGDVAGTMRSRLEPVEPGLYRWHLIDPALAYRDLVGKQKMSLEVIVADGRKVVFNNVVVDLQRP